MRLYKLNGAVWHDGATYSPDKDGDAAKLVKLLDSEDMANLEELGILEEVVLGEEEEEEELPTDFPGYGALLKAGYANWEFVREASDEDLLEIDGIGPKTVEEIREQLPDADTE